MTKPVINYRASVLSTLKSVSLYVFMDGPFSLLRKIDLYVGKKIL